MIIRASCSRVMASCGWNSFCPTPRTILLAAAQSTAFLNQSFFLTSVKETLFPVYFSSLIRYSVWTNIALVTSFFGEKLTLLVPTIRELEMQ